MTGDKVKCRKGHNLSEDGYRTRTKGNYSWKECKQCIAEGQKRRFEKYKLIPNYSRDSHLKSRYGITSKEFDIIFAQQDNRCAICLTNIPSKKGFVVDHNHRTGKIRGILCDYCNRALGFFMDNTENMKNAIEYINKDR